MNKNTAQCLALATQKAHAAALHVCTCDTVAALAAATGSAALHCTLRSASNSRAATTLRRAMGWARGRLGVTVNVSGEGDLFGSGVQGREITNWHTAPVQRVHACRGRRRARCIHGLLCRKALLLQNCTRTESHHTTRALPAAGATWDPVRHRPGTDYVLESIDSDAESTAGAKAAEGPDRLDEEIFGGKGDLQAAGRAVRGSLFVPQIISQSRRARRNSVDGESGSTRHLAWR